MVSSGTRKNQLNGHLASSQRTGCFAFASNVEACSHSAFGSVACNDVTRAYSIITSVVPVFHRRRYIFRPLCLLGAFRLGARGEASTNLLAGLKAVIPPDLYVFPALQMICNDLLEYRLRDVVNHLTLYVSDCIPQETLASYRRCSC